MPETEQLGAVLDTPKKKRANLESGRSLVHLASRIFNAPLAIWQKKGDVILHLLGPRLGITELPAVDASMLAIEEQARHSSAADRFDDADSNNDKPYSMTSDGIAVCDISGTLVRRATGLDALSGLASYETIEAELVGALTDANVKGILMCCDSPGGEVGGLFDLVDKIYSLKGAKPMHAAVSEMACSAMYALASVCDKITVTQTGAVGSIGVYALHVDVSGLNEQMGVTYTYIYAGEHKIDGNPNEPLTADVKADFQKEIDRTYDMFVDTVSKNRKMPAKKVRATEARVYYGADAVTAGLADSVGTPEQAMAGLRSAIGKKSSGGKAKAEDAADLAPMAEPQLLEMEGEMPAIPAHKTETTDESWDAGANEKRLRENEAQSYYEQMYAYRDPDKDATTKGAYSYPNHMVNADGDIGAANIKACQSGIGNLNGGRGGTNLSDTDRRGVYKHLSRHITDAGLEAPPLKSESQLAAELALAAHTAYQPQSEKENQMAKDTLDAMASKEKESKKADDDYMKGKKAAPKEGEKDEDQEDDPKPAKRKKNDDDDDDDENDGGESASKKKKADKDYNKDDDTDGARDDAKKAKKADSSMKECPECEGTGKDDDDETCAECGGTGKVKKMEGKKAMSMSQAKITEVVQLCELAGLKNKAADFLSEGLTLKEVRAKLVDLRSKQSTESTPSGRIGMTSGRTMAAMEQQAQEYARQHPGISKQKAFVQMLEANPDLYAQYKNERSMEFAMAQANQYSYLREN